MEYVPPWHGPSEWAVGKYLEGRVATSSASRSSEKEAMRRLLAVLLALSSVALASDFGPEKRVPDLLRLRGSGNPIWVSAEAALTESGELRSDLVSHVEKKLLAHSRAPLATRSGARLLGPSEPCTYSSSPPIGARASGPLKVQAPAGDELDRLIASSIAIYELVADATASGFFYDEPGTLLSVSVSRRYKESEAINIADGSALLFHNYARFAVGRHRICVPNEPLVVGDRFIVFVDAAPVDSDHRVIYAGGRFAVDHSAGMRLGFRLRNLQEEVESYSDLTSELDRRLPARVEN